MPMKKLIFLMILLSMAVSLMAAPWASLDDGEEKDMADSPMLLDLTASGSFNSVIIGFSDRAVTSFSDFITDLDSYDLELGEDGIAYGNEVYVFYQIQSAQNLDITLYALSPLLDDTNTMIYFDVSGRFINDDQSLSFIDGVTDDGLRVDNPLGFSSPIEGVFVYRHRPEVGSIGAVGSYQLDIKTEDYRAKPMGKYTSQLVVRIDSV